MNSLDLIAIVLVILALAPASARADDTGTMLTTPQARAELERGLAAHAARDYETAIEAFRAAYAIEPHPDLLFALAQAERLSGDCASALPLYRQFLATAPSERKAVAAQRSISRCERAISTAPTGPDERVVQPPPVVVAPSAEPARPPPPRWYRDAVGGVLVATGTVAVGAGGFALWKASSTRDGLAAETRYSSFLDRLERADRQRWIGRSLGGAGIAVFTAGVVRYVMVANRAGSAESRVGITATLGQDSILIGVAGGL